MKKYYLPSLLLIVFATIFFGACLPFALSVISSLTSSKMEDVFVGQEYFISSQSNTLSLDEAMQQAKRISSVRRIPLDEVQTSVREHLHT